MDSLIREAARRLFNSLDARAVRAAIEAGRWPDEAWQAIEESGFLDIACDLSGEISWSDVLSVPEEAGAAGICLPVSETIIARVTCMAAGIAAPEGPCVVAFFENGRAPRVPFGRFAGNIVALRGSDGAQLIAVVPAGDIVADRSVNFAGEPRDTLNLSEAGAQWRPVATPAHPEIWSAALTCGAMSGAAKTILAMSIRYARDRVQFGKPIARFQAVQHMLARMAAETAVAGACASLAAEALAGNRPLQVSAAKARASEAAGVVAALAHQVHGAIGLTLEHELPYYSRRLWSWRDEHGSEFDHGRRIGSALLENASSGLWQGLTAL